MKHEAIWPELMHLDSYDETATETAFLLGGIGTGNVSLGARGELKDWEVFNKPGKGNAFPYTFFALHVREEGADGHTRVLEGPIQPPHSRSHGYDSAQLAGLPRMQHSQFRAEYPLCAVRLEDSSLPVEVCLEAYTPFIPLDDEDSSLPIAILRYRVRNRAQRPCFVSVAGSMANMASFDGYGAFNYVNYASDSINRVVGNEALRGILYEALPLADGSRIDNSFCLSSSNPNLSLKPNWYHGAWYDGAQEFWDDFSSDGLLSDSQPAAPKGHEILFQQRQRIGALAAWQTIPAGEEALFSFFISWHIPLRELSWQQSGRARPMKQGTRNHYSLRFDNAFDVAAYTLKELPRLEGLSLDFHRAFFGSSLPREVLDAASANITALRSTTCFRIGDGSFFGWEGCFDASGCCDGSCTHVWNYAQTVAHLFPKLEQSMREDEFLLETGEDGAMNFRSRIALQDEPWTMPPAIDGQCGSIVRLVREWRISGDDTLMDRMGGSALKALDFAIRHWDRDGDGLPDSGQHNTYDIAFHGLNPLSCGVFLAALKAGAVIAQQMGAHKRAEAYQSLFEAASRKADELLWNGEYYVQRLPDVDAHPYQHGLGCLSDQLFGQFLAHTAGLGYILPPRHVRQALRSIHRYNFRQDLAGHESVQRCFALPGEPGLLLCSWPMGGRPRFPFVYCNEVWTGIEYQVAACMIWEGLVEEGLQLVRAARSRHDGRKRNPFDEVECGHHYARSMASWALIPALSGLKPGLSLAEPGVAPRIHAEDFCCFHSDGKAWGVYRHWIDEKGLSQQAFEELYRAEPQLRPRNSSSQADSTVRRLAREPIR